MKYLKVMFGDLSGANGGLKFKIGEVNVAHTWNPSASTPQDMGGFNFSVESKILRWLIRGDTLYDVTIPEDAEIVDVYNESSPHGIFRSNKIILTNPRDMTDELAYHFYKVSDLPERSYYKSLAGCMVRGYRNTCIEIIKDKVNKENIKLVLDEIKDFIKPNKSNVSDNMDCYNEIMEYLNEIDSDLLISRFIDKDIYVKKLTNDKVINLTGESGSGKSYYSKAFDDSDHVLIDTDLIFTNKVVNEFYTAIKNYLINKYGYLPDLVTEFDKCYIGILEYMKRVDKIIVIDSAQFRNVKNLKLLKGEVMILRTSIEKCYERCINRFLERYPNASEIEKNEYRSKKKRMFKWYRSLNNFIKEVDKYEN